MYAAAVAFKIMIRRPAGADDIEDRDIYGCPRQLPLTHVEVPPARVQLIDASP